jgi:hypothetical protein
MTDYDVENQFELGDLAEDSDEGSSGGKRTSFDEGMGVRSGTGSVRIKKEGIRPNAKSTDR